MSIQKEIEEIDKLIEESRNILKSIYDCKITSYKIAFSFEEKKIKKSKKKLDIN